MKKTKDIGWSPFLWGLLGGFGTCVVFIPTLVGNVWWLLLSIPIGGLWTYWTFRKAVKI